LRAQTLTDWKCIILDGGSNASSAALIREAASDARFVILRAEQNLGAPENFARVLAAAPHCEAIAFADADDDWDPAKLEKTCQALWATRARLAYCDARLIAENGSVLSPTFWTGRRNQWRDPVSMLLANTVTTAASVIAPELRDIALPFPQTRSKTYFDQWLALCALSIGSVHYVDESLYGYVQHAGQDIGHQRLRRPPLIHDLYNLWRIGHARCLRAAALRPRSDMAHALEQDLLRIKHLSLLARLRAGAGISSENAAALALMAGLPHSKSMRARLWRRGLARFGAVSDTLGNDWRMLAAAESRQLPGPPVRE
jgi:glycosyltransferase involved in cell wall biosynthesis